MTFSVTANREFNAVSTAVSADGLREVGVTTPDTDWFNRLEEFFVNQHNSVSIDGVLLSGGDIHEVVESNHATRHLLLTRLGFSSLDYLNLLRVLDDIMANQPADARNMHFNVKDTEVAGAVQDTHTEYAGLVFSVGTTSVIDPLSIAMPSSCTADGTTMEGSVLGRLVSARIFASHEEGRAFFDRGCTTADTSERRMRAFLDVAPLYHLSAETQARLIALAGPDHDGEILQTISAIASSTSFRSLTEEERNNFVFFLSFTQRDTLVSLQNLGNLRNVLQEIDWSSIDSSVFDALNDFRSYAGDGESLDLSLHPVIAQIAHAADPATYDVTRDADTAAVERWTNLWPGRSVIGAMDSIVGAFGTRGSMPVDLAVRRRIVALAFDPAGTRELAQLEPRLRALAALVSVPDPAVFGAAEGESLQTWWNAFALAALAGGDSFEFRGRIYHRDSEAYAAPTADVPANPF